MRDLVKEFFARLHASHLKARGYRKKRHTFSRNLIGFTERIQFQGSAWNAGDSSWRLYVNFGVQFEGLPPRIPDRDLPGTHCWTRLHLVDPDAAQEFDLIPGDNQLAGVLAHHLERASQRVQRRIDSLRERCVSDRTPRLTLDEEV